MASFLKCRKSDLFFLSPHREELHLGPHHPGGSFKCGPVNNGTAGRRPTLIEPERLKDFGEEHLLNGDVKVYDTKVVEVPEIRLTEPPKTRRVSEFRIRPKPQYLRFEDISAAAFRIQTGIQKTPCTVLSHCVIHIIFHIFHKIRAVSSFVGALWKMMFWGPLVYHTTIETESPKTGS